MKSEIIFPSFSVVIFVKVKWSLNRPGQPLRFPWSWGFQISRQSAHDSGKVTSPTHWPPVPHMKYSWYSSDYVDEKFWWHHRESKLQPSDLCRSASTSDICRYRANIKIRICLKHTNTPTTWHTLRRDVLCRVLPSFGHNSHKIFCINYYNILPLCWLTW